MRRPRARHRAVDPWRALCGVTGEVRRLAPVARRRTVTKRRPYEPRIVGGKVVIMPADLQRLHQRLLNMSWPFWRGETGAAWEFHGSDGSASEPRLSSQLCRCGLAFIVVLRVAHPSHRGAPWCNGVLHGATVRQRDVGFAFCA